MAKKMPLRMRWMMRKKMMMRVQCITLISSLLQNQQAAHFVSSSSGDSPSKGYSCSSCMYPCHAKCLEDARSVPCSHTPANGRRREDSIILESEDVAGLRDQVLVSDRQSAPIFLVSLDIHLSIMKMLCIRDILSCAKTCRFMLAVTSKPALWPHGRNILSLRQSWLSLTPRLFKDESNYHFPDISYLSGIGQQGERVICACKHGQYFRDTSVLTIDSTTGRTETVDVSVGYLDVSDPRGGIVGWGGSPRLGSNSMHQS